MYFKVHTKTSTYSWNMKADYSCFCHLLSFIRLLALKYLGRQLLCLLWFAVLWWIKLPGWGFFTMHQTKVAAVRILLAPFACDFAPLARFVSTQKLCYTMLFTIHLIWLATVWILMTDAIMRHALGRLGRAFGVFEGFEAQELVACRFLLKHRWFTKEKRSNE